MATIAPHFSSLEAVAIKAGERTERIASKQSLLHGGQIAGFQVVPLYVAIHILELRVRKNLKDIHRQFASLEIATDEDRTWCKQTARKLSEIARDAEAIDGNSRGRSSLFFFRKWNEDAICLAEDAAETLALAASPEFKRLLEDDLEAANASP